MSDNAVVVTDLTFDEEVLNNSTPVLVDFWAGWCGPCKMIGPVVEELAAEYKDRVKVAKVDVDSNRQVAGKLGVMSIPTLIMFKDGEEIDRIIGMTGKEQLKQKINQHLT